MKKGGYQIVDLSKETFTSGSAKTVPGIASLLVGARGKRPVISGLKVGSTKYGDFDFPTTLIDPIVLQSSVATTIASGAVDIGDDTISVTVKNNDAVTVSVS